MIIDKELKEVKTICRLADLVGKRVLEVGCGNGRVSKSIYHIPMNFIAVDVDRSVISEAINQYPMIDFRVADGGNLPFPDHEFDLVIFTLSLHHQNPDRALSEALRVLDGNGSVLVIEPDSNGEVQTLFNLVSNEDATLKQTFLSVMNSRFTLIKQESILSAWEFKNKGELYNYDFGQGASPLKNEIIMNVDRLLGARLNKRPVIIYDLLNFFLLSKDPFYS